MLPVTDVCAIAAEPAIKPPTKAVDKSSLFFIVYLFCCY
jgi:hypothetical protein